MIGDCFKGILFTVFFGFALLGVATVIPDTAWDRIPPRLVPLRAYLAERGVINEKYRETEDRMSPPPAYADTETISADTAETVSDSESDSGFVCSGGVCHLKNRPDPAPVRTAEAPVPAREFVPIDETLLTETPSREKAPAPRPLPSSQRDAQEDSQLQTEEPAFIPEQSLTGSGFGDTLPDLGFGEDPFPEDEFPLPGEPEEPVVRGAQEEPAPAERESSYGKNNHMKSVSHFEPEKNAEPLSRNAVPASSYAESQQVSAAEAPSETSGTEFEPPLHDQLADWIERSKGAGAIAASFLKLNEIREKHESDLSPEDQELLNKTLDRLAFRVFYQPDEFVLWQEYTAQEGETLASIAEQHKVTPEFLAAINSIRLKPEAALPAGTELKVVEGPVSADVSFSKKELLLKFNGLYAGRFKMGYAERAAQVRGEFPVVRKIKNPDYNGPVDGGDVGRIAGGDARNPLGSCWIELDGGLGLQGTNNDSYVGQRTNTVGGLIFSNKDISHLNILLAKGAMVRVTD